jgi:hypothetical protein
VLGHVGVAERLGAGADAVAVDLDALEAADLLPVARRMCLA